MDDSWNLNNADLIQQLASLLWTYRGSEGKKIYQQITGARICIELWKRLSGEREIEAYKNATILAIADYIKNNPRASQEEIRQEVIKQIQIFAASIQTV